jgi:hypothetical protein
MYRIFNQERNGDIDQLRKHFGRSDRDVIKEWVQQMGPYRFTGTLNFSRIITPKQAWEHCGTFIRRFHKRTLHRRWATKGMTPHGGVVIMEVAPLDARRPATTMMPHFHFLLRDHPSLARCDHDAISSMNAALQSIAENLKDGNQLAVCDSSSKLNGFKIVSTPEHLSSYLAKQVHYAEWKASTNVKLICGTGVG